MLSLDPLRLQLSQPTTSVQLGLLGVLAGICSALVIILFRLTIEKLQLHFVDHFDNFTQLDPLIRFIFPLFGVLLISLFIFFSRDLHNYMGIPFVIHWVKTQNGAMPLRNAFIQFLGGATALICGFSVGREGPAVHIGASSASFFGSWLQLPYNAIRTLTGCGISAGIAASFNTPLAAVVFVMEVVFREYKIHIFIPIMLAAVTGALLTRLVFGDQHELSFFTIVSFDAINYPLLIICSIVIGAVAYVLNATLLKIMTSFRRVNRYLSLLLAGLITDGIGFFVPHALGSGMGAIQFIFSDINAFGYTNAFGFICTILVAKFIATVFTLGLGIPGGFIGPVLGLGVLLGTLFGLLSQLLGFSADHIALYAVLSMAGLMAATLHSPLAALVSILELTSNPALIAPAMLVIAVSYTVSVQVFANRSLFVQQLTFANLSYRLSPANESLQKIGVLIDMNTSYTIIDNANEQEVNHYLAACQTGDHLIIRHQHEMGCTFQSAEFAVPAYAEFATKNPPIRYWPLQGLSTQATLADAFELMKFQRDGAIYIYRETMDNIVGVISWQQIRQHLLERSKYT